MNVKSSRRPGFLVVLCTRKEPFLCHFTLMICWAEHVGDSEVPSSSEILRFYQGLFQRSWFLWPLPVPSELSVFPPVAHSCQGLHSPLSPNFKSSPHHPLLYVSLPVNILKPSSVNFLSFIGAGSLGNQISDVKGRCCAGVSLPPGSWPR